MTDYSSTDALRIGIDGRELMAGTYTGFGRYLENFLGAKVTLTCPHELIIYGNQFTDLSRLNAKYITRVIPENNTLCWDQVSIVSAISKDQLDVFFTPYDKIPLRAACPVVMTIHDLLYQYVSDLRGMKKWMYNTLYRLQRGYMARSAAKVLTVSEYSRQDIARYYGLARDEIAVTYNAVSNRFQPDIRDTKIENIKSKYSIPSKYIFNLNNFKPHKNAQTLVTAFAKLSVEKRHNTTLVIGGKHNPFTKTLQAEIERLQITDAIHLPGVIEDEDLPAIYAGATCFVITSTYEGFGIPPLEAMASGTPVISSDATSLPEVMGDAGILVSPHDTDELARVLEKTLNDEDMRKSMTEKGLQRAKLFTQEEVASRILKALETTAGWNS